MVMRATLSLDVVLRMAANALPQVILTAGVLIAGWAAYRTPAFADVQAPITLPLVKSPRWPPIGCLAATKP